MMIKTLNSWYRKAQYPFWYVHTIVGVLWQAVGEFNRGRK